MIPKEDTHGNSGGFGALDRLLVPLIVVLVGVASFGLGRLSAKDTTHSSLVVHQEGEASTTLKSTVY